MGEKIKEFINTIKNKKKSSLIIAFCVVLVLIILLSEFFPDNKQPQKEENDNIHYENYTVKLENKLEKIISSIEGAGECEVMVTLDTGEESIYAKQAKNLNEDRDESSKSSDEYEYVVLKSSSSKEEGMLLKIIEPNVRGVAIVCRGGDDPQIKENIISAVSAVLDIKSNKISITKMK